MAAPALTIQANLTMTESNTEDRYPDVGEDPDGWDRIVSVLQDVDQDHAAKAALLMLSARTEFHYAKEDGELPDDVTLHAFLSAAVESWEEVENSNSSIGDAVQDNV